MKHCLTTLLGLILFAIAGCAGGRSVTDTAKLNCSQVTDLGQIPSQAITVGVDFVTALHSYDIKRIRELVEPDQREAMAKEAFNGPNASPIKMLETPKVTDGSLCGKVVKLTVRTSAEYSGGYIQRHTIYLTVRQYGNNWLIAGMAADYDAGLAGPNVSHGEGGSYGSVRFVQQTSWSCGRRGPGLENRGESKSELARQVLLGDSPACRTGG